ncbi:hypothetical protein SAMD00023353_4000840 [Rosellinia necatrix]|uniref:Amidoligase enzyme n=1 Tax=Rosellinia necatrix TaxID=77044 RepID=A0A1W2TM87_ROSNE|nr:hypothetical protein SAMD00023353_4000840 [Rosellinia necatrix]
MDPVKSREDSRRESRKRVKIYIGVETEAPLAVIKRNIYTQEDELLRNGKELVELCVLLQNEGFDIYSCPIDEDRDPKKWAVTYDSSIEVGTELQGVGAPIEIKSPILAVDNLRYEDKFRTLWRVIEPFKIPSIEYWKMASTHIHFSLNGTPQFRLEIAQNLAFCIVYFEQAITDLVPAMTHKSDMKRRGGWKNCRYHKKNSVRPKWNDREPLNDLHSCWNAILGVRSIQELFELFCYDTDLYRRTHGLQTKNWKWNFKGVKYETIEFRQMPPSRSAQETLDWISFTTGFVRAAAGIDRVLLSMASQGEISFTEALGLPLSVPQKEQQAAEKLWAYDLHLNGITVAELAKFVPCEQGVWDRISQTRDQIEAELAMLPNPKNELPTRLPAWIGL